MKRPLMNLNRKANCKNPYQGTAKKVLCVCSAGLLRSPTVANVLHNMYGHNTRAVGVDEDFALIPMDEVLIHWADEIVFVHPEVRDRANEKFSEVLADEILYNNKEIVVLNLPDQYEYQNKELVQLVQQQYGQKPVNREAET